VTVGSGVGDGRFAFSDSIGKDAVESDGICDGEGVMLAMGASVSVCVISVTTAVERGISVVQPMSNRLSKSMKKIFLMFSAPWILFFVGRFGA